MSRLLRTVLELPIKLYRFAGPALLLAAGLIAVLIFVPMKAEQNAVRDSLDRDALEIMTFKEVGYDEKRMDRVFSIKVKNSGNSSLPYAFLYITDKNGKIIYNDVRGEFNDLRINGRYSVLEYIPPGSECTLGVWIDDYKLNGLDHIYITDVYSKEKRGRRFEIEVKEYK